MTKINQINDKHRILIKDWRPFVCLNTLDCGSKFAIKSKKFRWTQKIPKSDAKNDQSDFRFESETIFFEKNRVIRFNLQKGKKGPSVIGSLEQQKSNTKAN